MFVNAKKAKRMGFTHHANFYGIPCYAMYVKNNKNEFGYVLKAKCVLLEPFIDLFAYFFILVCALNRTPEEDFRIVLEGRL